MDAWDDVRRDEAADAGDLHRVLVQADDAERSVGRERDDRGRHALRRRLELPAGLAAEPDAPALCTQAAAPSAERSCVALEAPELQALLQPEAQAAHLPQPPEARAQKLEAGRPM